MTEYRWRSGARTGGVKPDVAYVEFERIRAEEGRIAPSVVVDAARDEDNPLHPAFEWDDAVAGDEYRLIQARQLIRSLVIRKAEQEPRTIYVHISAAKGEGGYQPIDVVVERPELYALAYAELAQSVASADAALTELRAAAQRSGNVEQLIQVEAIEPALTDLKIAVEGKEKRARQTPPRMMRLTPDAALCTHSEERGAVITYLRQQAKARQGQARLALNGVAQDIQAGVHRQAMPQAAGH